MRVTADEARNEPPHKENGSPYNWDAKSWFADFVHPVACFTRLPPRLEAILKTVPDFSRGKRLAEIPGRMRPRRTPTP
jgi:hypothetical protein